MKRVLLVQSSNTPKKEESVPAETLNFRREFLNITELITSTFSSLEQKISFLDTKINSVSRVCSNILHQTELFIKDNKCSFSQNSIKCCQELSNKIENVHKILNSITNVVQLLTAESLSQKQNLNQDVFSAPVVLVPNKVPPLVEAQVSLDSSFQVISLNSEQDYPDGSWLGDENQLDSRVRVPITPGELLHINTHCLTPEKMALTLLDHLFPREVLAVSNLTGKGKHGKKQLDPLLIYGIRCHLLYRFGISEKDWFRIKQNMDSKCRTVWRRKIKGMPIGTNKADQHYKRTCEENEPNDLQMDTINMGNCNNIFFANTLISENVTMEDIEEEDEELEDDDTEIVHIAKEMHSSFETESKFTDSPASSKYFDNYDKNPLSKLIVSDKDAFGDDYPLIMSNDDDVGVRMLDSTSPLSDHEFILT